MPAISEQLTICILCKNNEDRIARAVLSVADLGAKILIIDSFSEDATFSVAQEAWLEAERSLADFEFVTKEWLGYVRTREESFKLVKTKWVMWLDSDEWIEEDLRKWMLAHLEYLNPDNIYCFRRQSHFLGHPIRHGGWYPDYKSRLCRVGHAIWMSGPQGAQVHESLQPTAAQGHKVYIDAHIGHLPFRDVSEQRETNETYSGLLAVGLCDDWIAKQEKPFSRAKQYVKVAIKFLENYFWKLGIADGSVGFKVAVGSAWRLKRCIEKARDLYWTKSG